MAGLINNLLPLAQPGVPARSVLKAAMIVAMIFCIVLLVAIFAAHLYGVFFLKPPDPNTVAGKVQLGGQALVHAQLHLDGRGHRRRPAVPAAVHEPQGE